MASLIHVENSEEYYKNGNIKSYNSLIFHSGLNRTVKVKNRDYEIYSQKLEEAKKLLQLEWDSNIANDSVNRIIEISSRLHIIADSLSKFDIDKFKREYLKVNIREVPEEPKYEDEDIVPTQPDETDEKYIFKPTWFHNLIGLTEKRNAKLKREYKADLKKFREASAESKMRSERNEILKADYDSLVEKIKSGNNRFKKELSETIEKYESNMGNNIANYLKMVMNVKLESNKIYKPFEFEVSFDSDDDVAIVDFYFPKESEFPANSSYKFVKSSKCVKAIPFKEKERNEMIKKAYYSLYIAIVEEFSRYDYRHNVKDLVLNGYYRGLDTRKGVEFEACIMSSKVNLEEFRNIVLAQINPHDTFKYFSGKGVPDMSNITRVEPIRFNNKGRFKLIETDSVLANLSAETNLAAMDWKEFESLIRDVFELEFKEQDIEIQTTQPSNDGGVDVVAFNRNPYTGGIILLQAKRYTNLVSPEPVRALKGSMEEHKAIRGILVTTSGFGGSSREFAAQHNITLIDGEHLVDLFKKHNYDFHINLEQAKLLNCK